MSDWEKRNTSNVALSTAQKQILEELGYTDLDTAHLARRLNLGVNKLKPELKEMEKAGKIRSEERGGETRWVLVG